ncbi:MAG TPA: FkbM family methyltransferase [Pyrinomonadaceae bacterium]|jgi:FkbM family methyltransferase|nr:FkbM family methyltransferase [Pyrinomonadaceae bacterium]
MRFFPSDTQHDGEADWETASEKDIYYCYRLILNREPDEDGWITYTSNIKSGMSVQKMVASFLNSVEFRNRQITQEASRSITQIVDVGGFKILVPSDDSPIAQSIIETRQYEPHITAAIQRVLKPGMVFVDVGANIGYLSLIAAREVGRSGKVISFEPGQHFCKLLYLSAKLNGFANIEIYPFAVADRRKNVIYDETHGSGSISLFDVNLETTSLRHIVSALTLDDVLRDEESVDLIKMDIEGAEHLALQGSKNILKSHRPIIISEFSPAGLQSVSGVSGKDFLRGLIDAQYDISILEFDNQVIDCGDDIEKVLQRFDRRETSHIDLLMVPKSK